MAESECTPQMRDDNVGWKVQVTVLTTWIPVLFAVAARVVIRQRKQSVFGIDDYFMLVAIVSFPAPTNALQSPT
nr:hypothetical protein CFP56_10506 [Quercus suber]